MDYTAPVVPPDKDGVESGIPALVGLEDLALRNTYYGAKPGTLSMVPHGMNDQIIWPKGTRHLQMEKAASGHWLIIVSHFEREANNQS